MKKHVIIGSSAASLGVLSRLRALDSDSEIVCITASKFMPYNTCLLADMLSGERESVFIKDESFFQKNRINLYTDTVIKIDADNQVVYTESDRFSYDTLFLGIGTSLKSKGLTFHTLEDTYALRDAIKDGVKTATVIGAGLSGVECSDSLAAHGIKVSLVEGQGSVLPGLIDHEGSKIIESLMPMHGVTFYKGTAVVDGNDVLLSSGKKITSDLVVFTTGGKPNIALAQNAGISINKGGVEVNDFMETSKKNIYAGGDVAVVKSIMGGKIRSTMWPDAMMQGMHAASSMAGLKKPYAGILPIGSSNFYGITFVSCGAIESDNCIVRKGEDFYHKFIVDNNIIVGFLMVNQVNNVGRLRKSILSKEPITEVLKSI